LPSPRRRCSRTALAAIFIGGLAGGCARQAERPASRQEALAACLKGCLEKVEQVAGPSPPAEATQTCHQTCGCIVDEMFEPGGARRKDPKLLPRITAACLERIAAKSPAPSGAPSDSAPAGEPAAPPSQRARPGAAMPPIRGEKELPPKSKLLLGRTLIPGNKCRKSRLPKFGFDEAQDRAWLQGEDLSWHLPTTWNARRERPDLLKIWGPPSRGGVFSVIELFVAPRCDGYDTQPVYERLAARAFIGLNKQADTVRQVRQRDWVGRLGGDKGAIEVASPVAIETPEGTRFVGLYVAQVRESKSFTVYAAGACPINEPWGTIPVSCKSEYEGLAKAK